MPSQPQPPDRRLGRTGQRCYHRRVAERIEYRAGVATCWVVNAADYFAYHCGPMQARRIPKAWIVAVGISDDRHLTDYVTGGATMQRLLGVKGGLGGLLIAYRKPGQTANQLATVTFDFGLDECQAFVRALTTEFQDRFVGTDTRDALMKKMQVSRTKENILIAAIMIMVMVVAFIITEW